MQPYISSGLGTLSQAGIERRNLLVFQIGLEPFSRLLAMDTLLDKAALKSSECVASRLSVAELFFLAFYFLRMGCLAILEQSRLRFRAQFHRLYKYCRYHQRKL